MTETAPRLTSFSHGGGCACKLGPADLAAVLGKLPAAAHPDLLVGAETRDDAAVYRLGPDLAVVLTADFITPVVDDPADFGAIAATNAMSDIWAMGGEALFAINLVGFPRAALDLTVLEAILGAGIAAATSAGCIVAGGHTIDDPELKYGLAVVGRVNPAHVIRNSTARAGDVLLMTKALGVGIISTAAKQDEATPSQLAAAVAQMRHPNQAAGKVIAEAGVSAATDVTGFGLLGHLGEMARGSRLAADLDLAAVSVLDGVRELAERGVVPGGTRRNLAAGADSIAFGDAVGDADRLVLADAQTSGGLLVAVPEDRADDVGSRLVAAGEMVSRVGVLRDGQSGVISVS